MKKIGYILLVVLAAAATVGGLLLKDNIATRKEEAKQVVFKLVNLTEQTTDPAEWGKNFPRQYCQKGEMFPKAEKSENYRKQAKMKGLGGDKRRRG